MVLVVESTPTNEDVSALSGRVITFPEGLIGCASWRHFRVESDGPDDAVLLLRCLDEPGVQLWAIDPFAIVPDYEVSIDEDSAQKNRPEGLVGRVGLVYPDGAAASDRGDR